MRPTGGVLLRYVAVIGTAFVLAFLAELPDKPMFASLVLGTRYWPSWAWAGAAAAFAVHMAIAVTAGRLLALLPYRVVDTVVAGLFLAGSAYLWAANLPWQPAHLVSPSVPWPAARLRGFDITAGGRTLVTVPA